ncbi:MAG: porin, partial [Gemmatimonadota bacterium]
MTSHAIRTSLVRSIGLAILLGPLAPLAMAQDLPDLEVDGLLRTGLRLESSRYDGVSGFEIYDARLGVSGRVGIVFDYALRAEYQFEADAVRLLDVRLSVPLRDEVLRLDAGLLMSGFGREAMKSKETIPFIERSQGSLALAPGRQVGAALRGVALEQRLRYWGGLYNGEGATFG